MNCHENNSKNIVAMIENIHLLRKLFIIKSTSYSPIHWRQIAIVKTIEENDNCTQADIAQLLNVTPASVAVSTKRLQKSGYITKTTDQNNLRCKRLSITNKGRELITRHIKMLAEYDNVIFKNFSENEKLQFMIYLDRILTEMKKIEGINNDFPDDPFKLSMTLQQNMNNIIHPDSDISDDKKSNL